MSGNQIEFSQLEDLARANRWQELEKVMSHIDRRFFLEKDILKLAALARRAWQLSFASYLLKPLVLNPDHQIHSHVQPKTLAEYAVVQIMLGGRKKALDLLSSFPKDHPSLQFAWVTFYFSVSDYGKAIPHLETSLTHEDDPYKRGLAELNLCLCLAATESYDEFYPRLNRLKEYFKNNNYHLLLANSLELEGQALIYQHRWIESKKKLEKAAEKMNQQNKLYSLFIEKWLLIVNFQSRSSGFSHLQKFMTKAKNLNHNQSIRDVIFYWGLFNKEEETIKKVFFGTPFASYRKFMSREWGPAFTDNDIAWNGHFFDHRWDQSLKIQAHSLEDLDLSKKEQTLLQLLSEDFFESRSVSSLFYGLNPNEYYDHEYSRAKTYKCIERLNKKLEKSKASIKIQNSHQQYHLLIQNGWMIRKTNPEASISTNHSEMDQWLLQELETTSLSRQDVMQEYQLSKSSCLRWLRSLQDQGLIEKVGQGPGSFYKKAS